MSTTSSDTRSHTCGLFSWRPQWLQKFVSYKMFVFYLTFISIPTSTILSYLTVVLSTIEKEFGLQSKEAGWIYSGNEIAQILFMVIIPFVGRMKRRPLFMGLASMLSAIGILLIALPHLLRREDTIFSQGTLLKP